MRDLYLRLGISQTASFDEIQKALQSCKDAKLRADVTAALLSEGRRKTYDQVHSTLTDIGALRAKLGLNHGENWQSAGAQDFQKGAWTPSSASQALNDKLRRHEKKPEKKSFLRRVIAGLSPFIIAPVVVGGFFMLISNDQPPATNQRYELPTSQQQTETVKSMPTPSVQSAPAPRAEPKFNKPVLALPATGSVQRNSNQTGEAPLQIKTSAGMNYLVRLEDTNSGQNVMDVFVRGGSTVEVEVPLGTYRLKYAAGQNWYGLPHLFGPETSYSKADTPFRFYIEGQRISGYTVTLYSVRDGNLRTSRLNPGDF